MEGIVVFLQPFFIDVAKIEWLVVYFCLKETE